MTNLTDSQIDSLADRIIISYCEDDLRNYISHEVRKNLKDTLETPPQPHKELFDALFKALDPHEKKFASMLKGIWEEERRIVVANIKKLKKAYRGKDAGDTVNQLLFPQTAMEGKVANGTKPLLVNVMDETGQQELSKLEVNAAFDVMNPEVQSWLKEYVPVFSKNLEAVSTEKLRRELIAGLEKGESIPELVKRVNETYANWNKVRSVNIARSETIRASNKGALNAYRQSGVVKSKVWVTHFDRRTCPSCANLDGKVISLEENYFNKGDSPEVIGGLTFKNDYTDIDAPPRHAMCRCAIAPSMQEVTRVVEWSPAKTVAEAQKRLYGFTEATLSSTAQFKRGVLYEGLSLERYNSILKAAENTLGKYKTRVTQFGYKTKRSRAYGRYVKYADSDAIQLQKTYLKNPAILHKKDRTWFGIKKQQTLEEIERGLADPTRPEPMKEYLRKKKKRLLNTSRWNVGDDKGVDGLYAATKHECYHAVYYKRELGQVWEEKLTEYGVWGKFDHFKISEYGASSVQELFTETGTAIDVGLKVPDSLKKAFQETIGAID